MEKISSLKQLEERFKSVKQDVNSTKNEIEFREAIRHLDAVAVKEVIAKGYSVSTYESINGSALTRAMYDCSDAILSIFKKYWPDKYENYYYDVLPITDKETLPEVVRKEVEQAIQLLISVMDVLYENGADINKRGMCVMDDTLMGVLLGDSKVIDTSSPFCSIINLLNYFQSPELVTWFIGKNDFDLNKEENIISNLINFDSTISTQVLNTLLLSGLKLADYNFDENGNTYSSLHECAIAGGSKTKNDKMILLYQFATPQQRARYNHDYETKATEVVESQINYKKQ